MINFNVAVIVPTYFAGRGWAEWLSALQEQSVTVSQLIVVDSGSRDGTNELTIATGITPLIISSDEFNHGGTRNMAAKLAPKVDLLIFLTQDAILSSADSLFNIVSFFNDPSVAAVCGRQLPHDNANPIATHARQFNYPKDSCVKSIQDVSSLGLKVAFMSNSFAAYRREIYEKMGGFPVNTILAEDMYLTAKMILSGYKVAYCATATVKHSHNYTPWQEFRRYFDIGVFHACEPWIQKELGGASGEGLSFVKSEVSFLLSNAPLWIPRALVTTACKLIGYKLGISYKKIPRSWRPRLSMYKSYWLQHDNNK